SRNEDCDPRARGDAEAARQCAGGTSLGSQPNVQQEQAYCDGGKRRQGSHRAAGGWFSPSGRGRRQRSTATIFEAYLHQVEYKDDMLPEASGVSPSPPTLRRAAASNRAPGAAFAWRALGIAL